MAEESLEELVAAGRRAVKDEQWGPLEGPWGPAGGGGLVRTASGRSMEAAAAEEPVGPPTTGEVPPGGRAPAGEGLVSRPGPPVSAVTGAVASVTTSGRVSMELSPEVLRQAAAMLEQQTQGPTVEEVRLQAGKQHGPPAGYRPPQDEVRLEVNTAGMEREVLERLLQEAPDLVRVAIPAQKHLNPDPVGRARSMVIQHLDGARLWLREALERLEEVQSNPDLR